MTGVLVIDKAKGMTSHDVVAAARKALAMKRIGHSGTLDPIATGVLPLLIGEATKLSPWLTAGEKEYKATLLLGVETDTLDSEGKVLRTSQLDNVDERMIRDAFSGFQGVIRQTPPLFSSVKIHGRPLYEYARKGHAVVPPERQVTIYSMKVTGIDLPHVEFQVSCSKGTFIRQLASDIGKELGCGAHLTSLRRIRSGPFTLTQAITIEQMKVLSREGKVQSYLIPMNQALSGLTVISVTQEVAESVRCGRPFDGGNAFLKTGEKGMVLNKDRGEDLVAIVEGRGEGLPMKTLRVFNTEK